jgi:hypothetical protein
MKRALVHGALLVLMLIVAFVTWTGGNRPETDDALTSVWDHDPEDVAAVIYRSRQRNIQLQRRGSDREAYLWGVQRELTTAAPRDTLATGSTAGAQTMEYPVGEEGDTLITNLARLRVLRDLGEATAAKRATYGLSDSVPVLTMRLRNRTERTLAIGKTVLGGGSVYVQDVRGNRIYVVPIALLRPFELGGDMLRLTRLQSFEPDDVAMVTVRADTAQRTMRRRTQGSPPMPVWTPTDNERADEAFGNFMAQVEQLWIARYLPQATADTLQRVIRIDYFASDGDSLGYLELFRTRPTAGSPTYLLRTARTIVLGEVYAPLAERVEQDVATLFGRQSGATSGATRPR